MSQREHHQEHHATDEAEWVHEQVDELEARAVQLEERVKIFQRDLDTVRSDLERLRRVLKGCEIRPIRRVA